MTVTFKKTNLIRKFFMLSSVPASHALHEEKGQVGYLQAYKLGGTEQGVHHASLTLSNK